MILLKANNELKNVFSRMIKTMGVNVVWSGNFVILNNFLILSGNVRSLIFNFDNRKVITNVIELPDKEKDVESVGENEILTNVLNMTLYAFGKWGVIKGLKVEKDYRQLNGLFYTILKDIKVTPGFRDDYFRFYKDNLQMTYEEVVQAALEEGKRKAQEVKEKKEEKETDTKSLGLWHKIRWIMEKVSFEKEEIGSYERKSARLGNNFYITGYRCPECQKKLYMAVYPQGQEFPIETEEGRVYLARSYTCDNCNLFYTPRPGKLLREGDNYSMKFGSDKEAYEDYQDLLGSRAERTSNYNFNEYASERGKHQVPVIEKACANMEHMTEEELQELEEKIEEGFYPLIKAEAYRKKIKKLLKKKQEQRRKAEKKTREKSHLSKEQAKGETISEKSNLQNLHTNQSTLKQKNISQKSNINEVDKEYSRDIKEGNIKLGEGSVKEENIRKIENNKKIEDNSKTIAYKEEEFISEKNSVQKEKYAAHMKVLNRMSPRQLRELLKQIQADVKLEWEDKEDYTRQVRRALAQKEDEVIRQKAEKCLDKPYGVVTRVMEEISQSEGSESVKQELLDSLGKLRKERGQQEAEQLIASMTETMNRNQYQIFCEKLAQYKEADISAYQKQLEEKRKLAETQEISDLLRRAKRSGRSGLIQMLQQLKEEFSPEQAASAIKEIEGKVRTLDEQEIEQICPDIKNMTFDEAAEAYEKIEAGVFLPELKINTLGMIDKRLTKLKMDECELLVEKLRETLNGKIKNPERIHFYEVRKVMRGEWEPSEAELVARALNSYAVERSRYEFPIIVCDSSGRKNGKEGFVLTPDHIFYNNAFSSEIIPIRTINEISGNTGLLNKGINIYQKSGKKTKIPGGIPAKELSVFAGILKDFVEYLQEKPESRSISYLAKEKHMVKCCYRCGYSYREGNICPKCGNQANQ
ncbi:MAG: hypothetical protein K1V96_02125 [Lachnospiraceae bacterium]